MPHPWLFTASVILLMAFVAFGVYRTGLLLRNWTPKANLILGIPDNILRVALIGLCTLIGWNLGPGPAALGWQTTYLATDLLWGGGAGLLLSGLLAGGGWLIEHYWGLGAYSSRILQGILPINRREWVGVLLALLPAAALEELLFRALPLGGLRAGMGTFRSDAPYFLLWPLAVCFGLLHWPQGGWGVVGATVTAMALSLLFLVTSSIWAPLAAHYIFNMTQIIVAHRTGLRSLRAVWASWLGPSLSRAAMPRLIRVPSKTQSPVSRPTR